MFLWKENNKTLSKYLQEIDIVGDKKDIGLHHIEENKDMDQ